MPYNLWRILYFASRGDGAAVRRWRSDLAAGALRLPGNIVLSLSELLQTVAISDAETLQTIKAVHARGYTLDPHTAVGVAAALHHPFTAAPLDPTGQGGMTPGVETYDTSSAVICMACAHPVKFAFTVCEALGGDPATAVTSMPDVDKHPCVQQVAAIAASARLGYTSDTELPAGCCAVMRRADKEAWEEQLRELIEGLPGGAHHRPPPSGQLRSAL
jgi:AcrR family transcriptional regulator